MTTAHHMTRAQVQEAEELAMQREMATGGDCEYELLWSKVVFDVTVVCYEQTTEVADRVDRFLVARRVAIYHDGHAKASIIIDTRWKKEAA